jgi:hypothetical protein
MEEPDLNPQEAPYETPPGLYGEKTFISEAEETSFLQRLKTADIDGIKWDREKHHPRLVYLENKNKKEEKPKRPPSLFYPEGMGNN